MPCSKGGDLEDSGRFILVRSKDWDDPSWSIWFLGLPTNHSSTIKLWGFWSTNCHHIKAPHPVSAPGQRCDLLQVPRGARPTGHARHLLVPCRATSWCIGRTSVGQVSTPKLWVKSDLVTNHNKKRKLSWDGSWWIHRNKHTQHSHYITTTSINIKPHPPESWRPRPRSAMPEGELGIFDAQTLLLTHLDGKSQHSVQHMFTC